MKNKMIFVYGLIMLVIVALFVVLGFVTSPENETDLLESQNLIEEKQNSIRKLEEENSNLKKENEQLSSEVENFKNRIAELEAQFGAEGSEDVTMSQALADLKDIYEDYKSGNVSRAKENFAKIVPMGYDDATQAYYDLLKDVLEA